LRSKSLVWRFRRATVALLKAHSQRWHRASRVTKAERCEERGDRVRALCALLVKNANPMVREGLVALLRQAIDEYLRSTKQPHVLDLPLSDPALDRQSAVKPAA